MAANKNYSQTDWFKVVTVPHTIPERNKPERRNLELAIQGSEANLLKLFTDVIYEFS
jgi:hypothetical protein